jgi:Cu2+-exporting ATPase
MSSLELLKDVDTVVFDKTGTLTLDQPHVAGIHTCNGADADTVLMYAAAAEHRQAHPIALAILEEAATRGIVLPEVDRSKYDLGYGLSVRLGDRLIRVGSGRFMALEEVTLPSTIRALAETAGAQGHSLVMVAVDDELVGALELQPTLRPEVKEVVDELRARGLDIVIISGDHDAPTRKMAESLGIPRYFADTLPDEKASLVAQLQSEGRSVCFVGDGINDSISLKMANVSVSLRGASTAAVDTAQIVLMGDGLRHLPFVFQLSDEFDSNMRQGFAIAVGQGVIVIAGALLRIISIVPGIVIWVGSLLVGLGIAQRPLFEHRSMRASTPAIGVPPDAEPEPQSDLVPLDVPAPLDDAAPVDHPAPTEEPAALADAERFVGYCVRCREKREFEGTRVELANGRRAAKGSCPTCGTKMSRILGKQSPTSTDEG